MANNAPVDIADAFDDFAVDLLGDYDQADESDKPKEGDKKKSKSPRARAQLRWLFRSLRR